MQKVMGNVAKKVAWVGRTASMVFGLALVLALVLGVASMAFGANGQNFILGNLNNTATAITKLTATVGGGPALQVENPSTAGGSTALELSTAAGKPPMKVNRAAKVNNLNSDILDGKDSRAFVESVYSKAESTTGNPSTDNQQLTGLFCDGDDFALSGGYSDVDAGTVISASNPRFAGTKPDAWIVKWRNDATPDVITVWVVCADVGAPRQ